MFFRYYAPLLVASLGLFGSSLAAKKSTSTSRSPSAISTSFKTSTTSSATPTPSCAGQYNQCGGIGFEGPLCCSAGLVCVEFNDSPYFSTCTSTVPSTTSVPSTTTTQPSTITSLAAPTSSCVAAGANCYNSAIASVTTCCDANAECVEGDTVATFTCEVIPPYTSPTPQPCAALWAQCGSVYWTGPTCCEPPNICVNSGSPYFYQCLPPGST